MEAPKRFTVTKHALEAYRKRYPGRLSRRVLEGEIREHVTQGISAGHIYNHLPDGFVLFGQKQKRLQAGRRFVIRQPHASIGFIIERLPQEDIVVTALGRVGARR